MKLEIDWHARFTRQASWTETLRHYLYDQVKVKQAPLVLEVGCGTGAILQDLAKFTKATTYGIDLDPSRLNQAGRHSPSCRLACGDAHRLPYPAGSFPITLCHFLLMWVSQPVQVLREMRRVTQPGGAILVLAEPDYSQRRDFPKEMLRLGRLQTESLRNQGADPELGGQLTDLLGMAGIQVVETGIIKQSAPEGGILAEWESEWSLLRSDLAGTLPTEELDRVQALDLKAWNNGQHINFIPTHYAWGVA